MKKLLLVFLALVTFSACAPRVYVNAPGQKIKACTTDFECMQKNGF